MPSSSDNPHPDRSGAGSLPGEFPGTDEVPVVNWPTLWRDRVRVRLARSDRHRWIVLATVLVGLFATGFTITVLAVSIGTIADDLGTTETSLSWIVTGPLLTLAICMPVFGKLGDVHGHRRVYLAGFTGFAIVSACTAFAWSGPSLVALRLLGALFGAATGPTSMALIMHEFPAGDRVKAMGWWSLVGAGAPVFGLVVGGPLVEAVGWRSIFLIQAPVSALAVLLAAVVLHETPRRPREPIDVAGAALLAFGMVCLLLALSQGGAWGWTDARTLTLFALAPVGLAAFIATEARAASPLLPLGFFRRPNFTPSLVAQFAANFAYMGGFFITPLFMQHQLGWGVTATGYAMLCRPLTFSLSSPFAGYVATRTGERAAAVVGLLLVVASMGVFAYAAAGDAVAAVFVALVLSGLGLGASSPSLVASVANAVDPGDLGVANAAQVMVSQLGVSVGIQLMIAVQESASFTAAYLVGGAMACVGVLGALGIRSLERAPSAGAVAG